MKLTSDSGLSHPTNFVDLLRAFDSHERGILFQWAAGEPFAISEALQRTLSQTLGVQVPRRPFVAMDYTIDWLHAAMTCFRDRRAWSEPQDNPAVRIPGSRRAVQPISGSQEDVDLLLAWEDDEVPRLVLIEAKGYTGWSNKQLASKAGRLTAVFTDEVRASVDVHFVLAGPQASAGLDTGVLPPWMKIEGRVHFLEIDEPGPRWGVRRSDPRHLTDDDGNTVRSWKTWRPVQRRW